MPAWIGNGIETFSLAAFWFVIVQHVEHPMWNRSQVERMAAKIQIIKAKKSKSVIRNKIVKIIFSDGKAYLNMNIRLKTTEPFELKISFLNEIYER